ncbi:transposase [Streptomyces sp. NPDC097617]|uniref:transposase n=1 Tax=Streptomyces sp. NPDC097617 TaxID=3366091 RepID=UPI0037FEF735
MGSGRWHGHGAGWAGHRRVTDETPYPMRTGAPWRNLPARFGPWKTEYERHRC